MNSIAVTGPRCLTTVQQEQALRELEGLVSCRDWHVGDATGLDALAVTVAQLHGINFKLYCKREVLPWKAQGAERSTRMVEALVRVSGTLHAWPNKSVPLGLMPSRSWPKGAAGSGTWGTIALAVGLGVRVELHPLSEGIIVPEWLNSKQLSLVQRG
jgi:hypothetical protein